MSDTTWWSRTSAEENTEALERLKEIMGENAFNAATTIAPLLNEADMGEEEQPNG